MSLIVIGPGGTGRTHALAQRARDEEAADRSVRRLTAAPGRAVTAQQVTALAADDPDVVVADDVQWFEADAADALLGLVDRLTVLASRRPPGPDDLVPVDLIDALDEALTRHRPAVRLGLLDIDAFAPALAGIRALVDGPDGGAMASDEVAAVHDLSGGSVGLAADLLATGWDRSGAPPPELVDAVQRRVRRAGPSAQALVSAWSVAELVPPTTGSTLEVALAALADDDGEAEAERAARSGGLLGARGRLLPLVVRAALVDLGGPARAVLHDRLGAVLGPTDRLTAARHLRRGTGSDPATPNALLGAALTVAPENGDEARALLSRAEEWGLAPARVAVARGLAAFGQGEPEALAHLDRAQALLADGSDDRIGGPAGADDPSTGDLPAVTTTADLLGFGLDLRELRFDQAARRDLDGAHGPALAAVAAAFVGPVPEPPEPTGSLGSMLASVADGLRALGQGRGADAVADLTAAADDFDRLRPALPLGFTPHQLGSLAAMTLGDTTTIAALTDQARDRGSGGVGEALTHDLLAAHGALMAGDYQPALAVLRAHTVTPDLDGDPLPDRSAPDADRVRCQRERLLLSALEAAIARRSGDTGRLRAAWARAEQALLRQSSSWLLADVLAEILACGARLGHHHRVEPVVEAVAAQVAGLPTEGPGPVAGWWLRLQVAIAADDADGVAAAAVALRSLEPVDRRSRARRGAGTLWAAVFARSAAEDDVMAAADALAACGDGWEASRLLGQAALDEPDPQAARRLLERARASGFDVVDEGEGDGLAALGLSEREAEVAVLVAEGRTHKEIGAQLYISPKTVEHHVARIRQKVGAGSRAELLGIIRDAVG